MLVLRGFSVFAVADDRVPDVREVRPYLVSFAGYEPDLHNGRIARFFYRPVRSLNFNCARARGIVNEHAALFRVLYKICRKNVGILFETAEDLGEIIFSEFPIFETRRKFRFRSPVQGKDHYAAGVAIQPVHGERRREILFDKGVKVLARDAVPLIKDRDVFIRVFGRYRAGRKVAFVCVNFN